MTAPRATVLPRAVSGAAGANPPHAGPVPCLPGAPRRHPPRSIPERLPFLGRATRFCSPTPSLAFDSSHGGAVCPACSLAGSGGRAGSLSSSSRSRGLSGVTGGLTGEGPRPTRVAAASTSSVLTSSRPARPPPPRQVSQSDRPAQADGAIASGQRIRAGRRLVGEPWAPLRRPPPGRLAENASPSAAWKERPTMTLARSAADRGFFRVRPRRGVQPQGEAIEQMGETRPTSCRRQPASQHASGRHVCERPGAPGEPRPPRPPRHRREPPASPARPRLG